MTWIAAIVPGKSDQLLMTLPCKLHLCLSLGLLLFLPFITFYLLLPMSLSWLSILSLSLYMSFFVTLSLSNILFHPLIFLPLLYPSLYICAFPCLCSPPPGCPSLKGRKPLKPLHMHSSHCRIANVDSLPLSLEIAFAFCCQIRIFAAVKMWLMKANAL